MANKDQPDRTRRNSGSSKERRSSAEGLALKSILMQHKEEKVGVVKERRRSALKEREARNGSSLPSIIGRSSSVEKGLGSVELSDKARRNSVVCHDEIPSGSLRSLLKQIPPTSYFECDTRHTSLKLDEGPGRTVDVFLNDFFLLRDDLKQGWYLFYLFVPQLSDTLKKRVELIHRSVALSANGLEHMKFVGEAEEQFLKENQGITNDTKEDVIRVAFKMKNGRMDPECSRVLSEYPILSLPGNTEWPLMRLLLIQSQSLRHDCFMKRGNLSQQELKFLQQGYPPSATAIWFLDRGESGRTAVLAGENWAQVRLNTTKTVHTRRRTSSGYSPTANTPDKRCVVNGRVVLRLASNCGSQPRMLMPSSNEMDKLKAKGIELLPDLITMPA